MNQPLQVWFVLSVLAALARVVVRLALLLLLLHFLRESNAEFLFLFSPLLFHLGGPEVACSPLQVERALPAAAPARWVLVRSWPRDSP